MNRYDQTGKSSFELKDSHFDGFEYKGYKIRTKLVIEGCNEYKPLNISNASDVYKIFKRLSECDRERFYSIHLGACNNVIGVDMVSQGCLDSAIVYPREVYKPALLSSASSLIFVHSHPSANTHPSTEDWYLTKRLKEAGELLGIRVLDHVIIGHDDYYSFTENDADVEW